MSTIKTIYSAGAIPNLGFSTEGEWAGWVWFKHPAGQWVSAGKIPDAGTSELNLTGGGKPSMRDFQTRIMKWMLDCFGVEIAADTEIRNYRFLEEALELVQACGCTRERALELVDYTYNRPVGEPGQEVGGVMVTLGALCAANKIDMGSEAERELTRIQDPVMIAKIRKKQQSKVGKSALPGKYPEESD